MTMYGTLAEADTYHDAQGNSSWITLSVVERTQALTRGSDYVDQRYREKLKSGRWLSMFPGTKTDGRNQTAEWPRTGATDYEGNEIPTDEVPIEVKYAAYEAALIEGQSAGSLSPSYTATSQVASEKVGPIAVEYVDGSKFSLPQGVDTPNRPIIPKIDEIIAPVLVARYELPAVRVV